MGLANLSNPLGGSGGSGSGGGGSGVTSIIAGAGISVDQATGAVTVTNTGTGSGDMLLAGVQTVTGAKTFGTIGGAVGKLILAGSGSGSSILNAAAAAGSTTIVLPNANSTLPVYGQQLTYAGPTAARTVTYPDASFSAARIDAGQTFVGVQAMTSPDVTTSLTTPSTTFALVNATATTVNAFGAATTLNIGAAATCILNFGGGATASEFRFLEPSGSGTNYTAFKAVAQSANITYSLPPTVGAAGTTLTDVAGNGVLTWAAPSGSGTVTVVGAGTLTSTALVTGGGSQSLQTPATTATMDSSGNISTPGSITSGAGGGAAGYIALGQGTAPTAGTTNITIYAPASVTSYIRNLPAAAGTGFYLGTNSAGVVTDTQVGTSGSGNVVLVTSATLVTPTIGVATATSVNKWVFTAPATAATLTAGADSLTYTLPGQTCNIGYKEVPANAQSTAYTTVLLDSGKSIDHPAADANARTYTIDSNANVAYPVGTCISFSNMTSQSVTIAITSDTLVLAGTGTTGSRTLAQYGVATARKILSTTWLINGTGLT